MNLEEVWRIREEEVYPSLFGDVSNGIFPLTGELFAGQFLQSEIDPRWLHYGVIEFAPTPDRNSWLYVTSGHSNPWDQEPEDYSLDADSGAGVEFVLATTQKGEWGIRILQSMLAFDLLLCAGRFPGRECLSLNDRIPLRAPINGDPTCELRNLIVSAAEQIPSDFLLPSGKVSLIAFNAITDAELEEAKKIGSVEVIARLRDAGFHPTINPWRRSLI